jgi:hypothetical protein
MNSSKLVYRYISSNYCIYLHYFLESFRIAIFQLLQINTKLQFKESIGYLSLSNVNIPNNFSFLNLRQTFSLILSHPNPYFEIN